MHAIVAVLTAVSVLLHTALGSSVEHSHGPSPAPSASQRTVVRDHGHRQGHGHHHHGLSHGHSHADDFHESAGQGDFPVTPHRHPDEGGVPGLATRVADVVLKPQPAAFSAAHSVDACSPVGRVTLPDDGASFEHQLGPPVRTHLFKLVLLI